VHCKYIPKYIQQDANLHGWFISANCSTCFGWYLHSSSGAHRYCYLPLSRQVAVKVWQISDAVNTVECAVNCVCVCVYMCGFCNVCVCSGFIMCACICNMYTVLWRRFFLPWLKFFRAFSSVVRQMPRLKFTKMGHGPHSTTLVVICVVWLLFVLFYVLFVCKCVLPPGDNPTAVKKYITYYYRVNLGLVGPYIFTHSIESTN
jgi:hypothetical protein